MAELGALSIFFTSLVAEAISLPANAFDRFFDVNQQHKLKVVKYPDLADLGPVGADIAKDGSAQGVGPHKDSMLTSYLLQATQHKGLQVQNGLGTWVDCPPKQGTLVVAIGQGLEALTNGVCASTTHRVLSPAPGTGARFSVPFFQGVSYDATFESMDVPAEILDLKAEVVRKRGGKRFDDVEFTFVKGKWNHLGEATLMNRIKSHPDVGERWYPDLLKQIYQQQREAGETVGKGSAY
jgi:isopenicillin N synthase-like dioxygenase